MPIQSFEDFLKVHVLDEKGNIAINPNLDE